MPDRPVPPPLDAESLLMHLANTWAREELAKIGVQVATSREHAMAIEQAFARAHEQPPIPEGLRPGHLPPIVNPPSAQGPAVELGVETRAWLDSWLRFAAKAWLTVRGTPLGNGQNPMP